MKREAGYIIGGILGIAASAGVSYITENIWAGFLVAIVFSVIYLIVLDRKFVQLLQKPAQKITIRILILALVLCQSFAAYMAYNQSQFTRQNLLETRSTIDEGVSKWHTQQVLTKTFRHYYSQEDTEGTMASSFRKVMGDRLNADGTIDFPQLNNDIVFTYEIISPDEIMITASAKIGKGENPEYMNVSSQSGKYQAVATLTPNGIDYEREN